MKTTTPDNGRYVKKPPVNGRAANYLPGNTGDCRGLFVRYFVGPSAVPGGFCGALAIADFRWM